MVFHIFTWFKSLQTWLWALSPGI